MATYTTNYNLEKPEATDPFGDFRESYNDNLDIIDANLGGGGGSGGHTILDGDGNALPQEDDLQFTGAVSVTDDNVNGKTIVDILGGNVYGAFIDTNREIASGSIPQGSSTYTATEDCALLFSILSGSNNSAKIEIDGVKVWEQYDQNGINSFSNCLFVKSGQTVTFTQSYSSSGTYKAYALIQGTNGIFAPVIYSDNERVIGVWRDNKPLYQRTFVLSSPINVNGSGTLLPNDIQTALADVEIMVDSECARDSTYSAFISPYVYKSGGQWYILSADSWGNVKFITLRYTKTTDVAGSGDYNTYGVPTVHYSTSEQVIGTWIDGKPIYQITLTNLQLVTMSGTVFNHGIANLDECIRIFGRCKYNNTGEMLPLPYTSNNMSYMIYVGNVTPTTFDIGCGNGFSSLQDISVTLQYTKTTD